MYHDVRSDWWKYIEGLPDRYVAGVNGWAVFCDNIDEIMDQQFEVDKFDLGYFGDSQERTEPGARAATKVAEEGEELLV